MKAPKFWSQPGSPLGKLLSPLGCAYRVAGSIKRSSVRPAHVNARVICVGNLVAGGTGKTPVSLAIAACLQREDLAFLTRGYGGRLAGPVRVARDTHTPAEVGDEAFLLARAAPVWVARDRVAGAEAAINAGSRLIVMDDGFQNPSLAKNVGIIVIDGETGFLIPPEDADGLAHALRIVIEDRDRAFEMGQASRKRAEQRYSWSLAADSYLTLLCEAADIDEPDEDAEP